MKITKKLNHLLTRNQIISSVVWATVILACSYKIDGENKEITYILISGFFIEFLRISSSNKSLRKGNKEDEN
jgi:hypothetical protein